MRSAVSLGCRQDASGNKTTGCGTGFRFHSWAGTIKRSVGAIACFSALINILALVGSIFMLEVYDRVLPSRSLPTLIVLSILVAGLFLFYGLLELIRARVLVRLATTLDAEISGTVFKALVRRPLEQSSAPTEATALRDMDIVRSFASGPGPTVLFDLPWVPFYLWVIYLFHPLLAVVAMAGIFALVAIMILTEACCRAPTRKVSQHFRDRQCLAETSHRRGEALVAMGMVERIGERLQRANNEYVAAHQKLADYAGAFGTAARVLRISLQSAILAMGAYLVIRHDATSGVMIAASVISARALAPLDASIPIWKNWVAARESWSRLVRLLETTESTAKLLLPCPHVQLSVECASVAPPGSRTLTVCDVSFRLGSGQGLGIIGPNASGKSSLARLLVGAWKPVRGQIRLDGASLDQWTSDALGGHIGYLPQNIALLPGSIADNISRFDETASADDIIAAANAAHVHDIIVGLPDGYETLLKDPIVGLSTGQQQRIALARALYREPFLVVLDEPSANLDPEGEAALLKAMIGVRQRGGIVVVIAHHPSTLAAVDTILILRNGKIDSIGPKDEVLSRVLSRHVPPKPLRIVSEQAGAAE